MTLKTANATAGTNATAGRSTVPSLADDPFSLVNLADPYPLHEKLREAGPVVWLEKYGSYAVTRYEPVYEILTDFETYISGGGLGPADRRKSAEWRPAGILESDPPTHTAMRRGLSKVVSPSSVRRLRSEFEPPARELVRELVARGSFDVVRDLAEVYPLQVFPDAVGIPQDGRENLLPYGSMTFNAFGPRNDVYEEAFKDADAISAWVLENCERGNLRPGGFGAGIWEVADDGGITADEAALLVRALLSAGVDTTVTGIGNTLLCLARNPEQWEKLRANPNLAKFAVDEALRLESPFQMFHRTAAVDSVIEGVRIPADSKILLFMGAANRDPRKWGPNADRFDLDRSASGHVAFGMGLHQCVGQPIARLEIELVLQALAETAERIELAGDPVPQIHNVLHAFSSIPVRVVQAVAG
ncbi:cytochrome P450 [Arthrobacter luteolus]|uniref:cytochrome P450 n=1 Tax=Arthrobacter luteolus TaxID=98672 RepID=UPI000837577C|nr:cytochrome P450 [Arthrobacter luteolus]